MSFSLLNVLWILSQQMSSVLSCCSMNLLFIPSPDFKYVWLYVWKCVCVWVCVWCQCVFFATSWWQVCYHLMCFNFLWESCQHFSWPFLPIGCDDSGSFMLFTVFFVALMWAKDKYLMVFVYKENKQTHHQTSTLLPLTSSHSSSYCRLFFSYCQNWWAAPYWDMCKILECWWSTANHWENFTTLPVEACASTLLVLCGIDAVWYLIEILSPFSNVSLFTPIILLTFVLFCWLFKLNLSFWHCDLSHHVWMSVWWRVTGHCWNT